MSCTCFSEFFFHSPLFCTRHLPMHADRFVLIFNLQPAENANTFRCWFAANSSKSIVHFSQNSILKRFDAHYAHQNGFHSMPDSFEWPQHLYHCREIRTDALSRFYKYTMIEKSSTEMQRFFRFWFMHWICKEKPQHQMPFSMLS